MNIQVYTKFPLYQMLKLFSMVDMVVLWVLVALEMEKVCSLFSWEIYSKLKSILGPRTNCPIWANVNLLHFHEMNCLWTFPAIRWWLRLATSYFLDMVLFSLYKTLSSFFRLSNTLHCCVLGRLGEEKI